MRFALPSLAAVALLAVAPARLLAATEGEVLSRLDAAATGFQSMTGKLVRKSYTAVIKDTTEESGVITMSRGKNRDVRMLLDFSMPDPRTVLVTGRKAEIFYPKIKTVQEYDLGKYGKLVDQFLLLGFGTSGKDLAKAYTVRLAGEETIGGRKAARLELTPKAADAKEHLAKVELWIPEGVGYPIQQKFLQPSGDYTLVSYADVKVNPPVEAKSLALALPPGVKREYPQK